MIRTELKEETITVGLGRLAALLTDLTPLMRILGDDMVVSTQDRMEAGLTPDGTPFAPRSQTTIDSYAKAGKSYGKPLNTSGMMRGEIHFDAGADFVEFGSNAIQAAVMQMGAAKRSFGTSSRGGPIPWGDIPARPFVGISQEDRMNLPLTIEAWLKSISTGTD